jgi:hypothetical protein
LARYADLVPRLSAIRAEAVIRCVVLGNPAGGPAPLRVREGEAMHDLVLPAFKMDCRDWLVVTPSEAGLPEELGGSPLLAVLSTVVLGDGAFVPASGVLTVGLLEEDLPPSRPVGGPDCVAAELLDGDEADGDEVTGAAASVRYLLPAPDRRLALLAEFTLSEGSSPEATGRIESLMASFRWTA